MEHTATPFHMFKAQYGHGHAWIFPFPGTRCAPLLCPRNTVWSSCAVSLVRTLLHSCFLGTHCAHLLFPSELLFSWSTVSSSSVYMEHSSFPVSLQHSELLSFFYGTQWAPLLFTWNTVSSSPVYMEIVSYPSVYMDRSVLLSCSIDIWAPLLYCFRWPHFALLPSPDTQCASPVSLKHTLCFSCFSEAHFAPFLFSWNTLCTSPVEHSLILFYGSGVKLCNASLLFHGTHLGVFSCFYHLWNELGSCSCSCVKHCFTVLSTQCVPCCRIPCSL